jgi:hypothetical protein
VDQRDHRALEEILEQLVELGQPDLEALLGNWDLQDQQGPLDSREQLEKQDNEVYQEVLELQEPQVQQAAEDQVDLEVKQAQWDQ